MLSRLRAAAHTLAPPPVLEYWVTRPSRLWSLDRSLAKVVAVEPASRDATTLVLRPNRHWQGCAPGQHVNVTVEVNGRRLTRAYSPSPVAGRADCIAITVKAVPGGRVSPHLCTALEPGDVVELGPAYGDMRAPASAQATLLLAAGSGITPLAAMLRQMAAQGHRAPVTLLYWARTRDELCFVPELRALVARNPHFTLRFGLTGEAIRHADERAGRLNADVLAELGLDAGRLAGNHVFACGPAGFVETARALVGEAAGAFLAEAFTPPVLDNSDTGTVRVTLARSGRTLEVGRGRSLLEAFEEQGLKPAHGCRMGLCNTCACPKSAGVTRSLLTGDTDAEPASSLRLCVSSAASDLVIDL